MIGIPNIKYCGNYSKEMQAYDCKYENISFYKPNDFFLTSENRNKFIKACENAVRKHEDYKRYINYVMDTVGINFCQVSSNIYSDVDAEVQMHHGPLFTLYDYVAVVLENFMKNNKKINTFRIADQVLQEHYDLNVQIVMLTVTNHEAVHNRDIFLNIKQGFGDISGFIERYRNDLTDDQKYRIYKYIKLCESTDSFDNNIFDVEKVKKMIKI